MIALLGQIERKERQIMFQFFDFAGWWEFISNFFLGANELRGSFLQQIIEFIGSLFGTVAEVVADVL